MTLDPNTVTQNRATTQKLSVGMSGVYDLTVHLQKVAGLFQEIFGDKTARVSWFMDSLQICRIPGSNPK